MATEQFGSKQKIGILQQSRASNAWNNPNDATDNYETMNYDMGVSIPDDDVTVEQQMWGQDGQLMDNEDRAYTETASSLPKINFTGVAIKAQLAAHLVAISQKVTEAATTPFAKSISPVNDYVDFAGNEGYLWTVAMGAYDDGASAGDGTLLKNALLNDFTFTVEPNSKGIARLAKISGTWLGNEMTHDNYLSGSWVARPTTGLFNDGTKFILDTTIGDTALSDVCYRSFTMTWNNNIYSDCVTTKANNFKIKPEITINFKIPYSDETYGILADYKAGSNVDVNFYNGAGTADGQLNIDFTKGRLTAPPQEFQDEYHGINVQMVVYAPSAGFASDVIKYTDTKDGEY